MTTCATCTRPITRTSGAPGRPLRRHPECRASTRAGAARTARARASRSPLVPWSPSWASYAVEGDPRVLRDFLGAGQTDADGEVLAPWLDGSPVLFVSTPDEADEAAAAVEIWAETRHSYGLGLRPGEERDPSLAASVRLSSGDAPVKPAPDGAEAEERRVLREIATVERAMYANRPGRESLVPEVDSWHVAGRRLPETERRPHIPSARGDQDPERVDVAFRLLEDEADRAGVIGARDRNSANLP